MTPFLMTPGNPTDARSNAPAIFASSAMIAITFFGVALRGVLIFCRSVIILPFSSSAAALIPVPPTSTARVVIDLSAGCFALAGAFAIGFASGVFTGCSSFICSLLAFARIDGWHQCARESPLAIRSLYTKLHLYAFLWHVLVATW